MFLWDELQTHLSSNSIRVVGKLIHNFISSWLYHKYPKILALGPVPPRHPLPHHYNIPLPLDEILVPLPEDAVVRKANGFDSVGHYEHHSGSLGPFGFYANFAEKIWFVKKNK